MTTDLVNITPGAGQPVAVDKIAAQGPGGETLAFQWMKVAVGGEDAWVPWKSSDYDTGAGSDPVPMVGLALPKAGGAAAGGTSTDPLRTDPTGTTTQPVSGPLTDTQLRAAAVDANVTDRDARLLGRAKILDSAGAVIDPATKGQLPAALAAGGGLKVEGVAGGVAQPVSMATQTPDVTDRAARELGRVRLWDGTDEGTVVGARQALASSDKGLPVAKLPARVNQFGAATATITPAVTAGLKELGSIFHPSGHTADAYITEIDVTMLVTTAISAGQAMLEAWTITAESATGTAETVQGLDGGGAASGGGGTAMSVRSSVTGTGTLGARWYRDVTNGAVLPVNTITRFPVFRADTLDAAIVCRASAGFGVSLRWNVIVAITGAVLFVFSVKWVEL